MAAIRSALDNGDPQTGNGVGTEAERFRKIRGVFEAALDVGPERMSAWLRNACSGDGELLRQVEELLAADELAGEERDMPPIPGIPEISEAGEPSLADWADCADWADVPANRTVGGYRIVREIGRGGASVVYLAQREDDLFSKPVAVKVLRRERMTPEQDRQFRQERKIVGNLDHPNIARLLDGGATDEELLFAGLPILAQKDSLRYRTGKFVRRHYVGVLSGTLVLLLLILAVFVTSRQARVARSERARAEHEAVEARRQSERAEARSREAEFYRKRAEEEAAFAREQFGVAEQRTREATREKDKADRIARQAHGMSAALLNLRVRDEAPLDGDTQGVFSQSAQVMSSLLTEGYDTPALRADLRVTREMLDRLGPSGGARNVPAGWTFSNFENYEVGIERKKDGTGGTVYIRSRRSDADARESAELRQTINAAFLAGYRVSLVCNLRSSGIQEATGMFVRVTDEKGKVLDYQKTENRSVEGWTRQAIVFAVPEDGAEITLGIILQGPGTVWAESFGFQTVDKSTGTTVYPRWHPMNLDFEARK